MKEGSVWRDFLNRREPGARWMLVLLALAVILETANLVRLLNTHDHPGPVMLDYTVIAVSLAALACCRWWSLPSVPAFSGPEWEVPSAARRWTWFMALAIALLALWSGMQRMKQGFTVDELSQLQSSSQSVKTAGDADATRPCLMADQLAAHFAVSVMQQDPDAKTRPVEWAARVFPCAAGVLAAGLVVLLAAALGSPRAGLAAGLIFALHPLTVQWSSEVSDFSLRLLAMGAVLFCVIRALHTNCWRWWLALSAAEAVFLLGSLHGRLELLVLFLIVSLVLGTSPESPRVRLSHVLRLLASLALAGLALTIPLNLVLKPFGADPSYADVWARLVSGIVYTGPPDDSAAGANIRNIVSEAVWRWPVLMVILPLAVVGGLYFMSRQDWRTRIVAGMFLFGLCGLREDFSVTAVLLLPVVLAWAGVGLMRLFPLQRRLVHAPLFVALVYLMGTAPARQRMLSIPRQPLREVLASVPGNSATVAGFGRTFSPYLERTRGLRKLDKPADLSALVDVAYAKDLPLFVMHSLADRTLPPYELLCNELETGRRFVLAGEFNAFDPNDSIRLYRYQPREQTINIRLEPKKN
jgi:hypothetical protein